MPVAANSVTGFGLRLLEQLGPGPVAFSPLSVHGALAALRPGASGETREALDAVLGEDAPALAVDDPAIRLALAQALWLDPRYALRPEFADAARRRGVDCRALDFADPAAPAAVNAWAADKTDGMIEEVVQSFTPDEVMALADAVFFDGAWSRPFERELTAPAPFTRPDGTTVLVPTMHGGASGHFEDDEVQAMRLDYGGGDLALHCRDFEKLPARLAEHGIGFERGTFFTLKDPRLDYLFFGSDNRSPTDKPAHFAHANGTTALVGVWLADADNPALIELLTALGSPPVRREVHVPDRAMALVSTLENGEIVLLPKSRRMIPGRPIIGASFRVSDLGTTRGVLGRAGIVPRTPPGAADRVVVEPTHTHGLWLEFRP